jgi:hypothetical protein
VNGHGLLGLVLERTRTDTDGAPRTTRGRCIAAWGGGAGLNLALEQDDGEVYLVSVGIGSSDRLRILRGEGRKVPLA